MQLNFEELKRIPIPEILARRGIQLRYRGDWANCPCPLPSHKQGDRGRNFTVNLKENYWRCFSESCNQASGRKGGDSINLLAALDNCSQINAAKKLAEMNYQPVVKQNKNAQHIAERSQEAGEREPPTANNFLENNQSAVAVKGYIHALDDWFNNLFKLGPELINDDFWKNCRKEVKAKVIESFRNGKLAATRS